MAELVFQCYKYWQLQYEFTSYKDAKEYINDEGGVIAIKSPETDKIMEQRLELYARTNI